MRIELKRTTIIDWIWYHTDSFCRLIGPKSQELIRYMHKHEGSGVITRKDFVLGQILGRN